jgi:isocitrate dehydrogenase
MGVDEQGKPREITHTDIVNLLHNLESDQLDFIKTENLCTFDGKAGYALGQGQ